MAFVTTSDEGAFRPAGDDHLVALPGKTRRRLVDRQIAQACRFIFIGKQNVDMVADEARQRLAVPLGTPGIGQRQRYPRVVARGKVDRPREDLRAGRRIEQIAFEIDHLRRFDIHLPYVVRLEFDAGAEIGVHRPCCIIRNENDRGCGRRTIGLRGGAETDTGSADVTDKGVPELVIMHPAGKSGTSAKSGDTNGRVRRRAAGDLARRPDGGIKRRGLVGIDEIHHSLADIVRRQEGVVAAGKNVDNGIADGQNVDVR